MGYKPPYDLSNTILHLIAAIHEKIGRAGHLHLDKPKTMLRRANQIKTIQSSLAIEGNTLTAAQVTAIVEDKRVLAPQKDILEVQNAVAVYSKLSELDPTNVQVLRRAHGLLMAGLVANPGKYRTGNIGVVKGDVVAHVAPPASMVEQLIDQLFDYIRHSDDLPVVMSCVFHYEFEFIHPFEDGNGRMGRLWQSLLLMQLHPLFEFVPVEQLVKARQGEYYAALARLDREGHSTAFIEYMLSIIDEALSVVLDTTNVQQSTTDRILVAKADLPPNFSRKDYMLLHKTISTATASRDLKTAIEHGLLIKTGEGRSTRYNYIK